MGDRLPGHRLSALVLLLLVGCTEPVEDSTVAPSFVVEGWENPNNPLAWIVEVTSDTDGPAWVEYGPDGTWSQRTPPVNLVAGEASLVQVLGLRADTRYDLRAVDPVSGHGSAPLSAQTMAPLPDWPLCKVVGDRGHPDEVFCTQYRHQDLIFGGFFCADRSGQPVWFLDHPDDIRMQAMLGLRDGGYAAVGDLASKLILFDRWGALTAEYSALWFEGRTRFVHDWVNGHEVIQLDQGRWEGALAFLTSTEDVLSSGDTVLGEGIIVYDPVEDEVLWDWHSHGALGDDVPIDPKIDHDYHGNFWLHGNALTHLVEEDGAEYFWLCARDLDWILKIDTATDGVVWRLGQGGDFELVNDLDDPAPQPVGDDAWFSFQHAPEIVGQKGDRTKVLIFDNRTDKGDWSRVVGLEIDESTRRAEITFEYGAQDSTSPGHFYASIGGDVDLMPEGDSIVVADARNDVALIEVGYPDGDQRWRMACTDQKEMYRVTYKANLYE